MEKINKRQTDRFSGDESGMSGSWLMGCPGERTIKQIVLLLYINHIVYLTCRPRSCYLEKCKRLFSIPTIYTITKQLVPV